MRWVLVVSLAYALTPAPLAGQVVASNTTAMLDVPSWSGTISASIADTTRSADGQIQKIVSRSIEGTVVFDTRTPSDASGLNVTWNGMGEVTYRVLDREITIMPGREPLTQTHEGSGTVSLDGVNCILRMLGRQGVYDLLLTVESFQVDLVTAGGGMEEPMRARTRPPRGGGLGGSVSRTTLPNSRMVLEGNATLQDGTLLRWQLLPRASAIVTEAEERSPSDPSRNTEPIQVAPQPVELSLPVMSMNTPSEAESGSTWFADRWEQAYRIAEVEIIPPDNDQIFANREHALVIRGMNQNGDWTPLVEVPVTPSAATVYWERHRPIESDPNHSILRLVRSFDSIPVYGIRFELNGEKMAGSAWTFWVRSAPGAASVGEIRHEWRYTHVW